MAQLTVKITGASRAATLTWDQKLIPLADTGGGNFAAGFPSVAGTFLYAIVVFGSPADPWSASVTDGTTTHNHAGHMSPAGFDDTGDTAFNVQS
ncbi:MAG: hypothetical protein ABSH56_27810 [Bryobacteraceae bacterium]|jgi:hypothetical protein